MLRRVTIGPDARLFRLRVSEIDRIELKGPDLDIAGKGSGPLQDHVIRAREEIARILTTLQQSEHARCVMGGIPDGPVVDSIEINSKAKPDVWAFGIYVHGDSVDQDYGPLMKQLFDKYRQRPLHSLDNG